MLVSFSSFRQLERLAIVDRNIAYADRSRAETATEVTIAVVESPTGMVNPESLEIEHRNLGREQLLFAFTVGGRDIRRGVFGACHRGVR